VGRQADVVRAFEHNINMQAGAVDAPSAGRAADRARRTKTMPNFKSVADLKGKKIGVSAPGSSTNIMANYVLAKNGLKPSDVSFVGVGVSQGAVAALRSGQIDAISNLDPAVTILARSNDIKIVSTRATSRRTRVRGPMPARDAVCRCLHRQEPEHRAGADQRDRAEQVDPAGGSIGDRQAGAGELLLGDRAVYIDAFLEASWRCRRTA
jgi:NitT/TauT family transport system substrate-binding protein